MGWDESKDLLQLQVDPAFKKKLQALADEDNRSLASECLWLIKMGIRRRERMEAVNDFPTDEHGTPLGWSVGVRKRKPKPDSKKTGTEGQ